MLTVMAEMGSDVSAEMLTDRAVEDHLIRFCESNQLSCHPLLDAIRDRNRKEDDLFYHEDGHMTIKGNKVLGTLIADIIEPKLRK